MNFFIKDFNPYNILVVDPEFKKVKARLPKLLNSKFSHFYRKINIHIDLDRERPSIHTKEIFA
jgi:hypothetical protein